MLSTMLAKLRIGPFHWRAIAPWRAARLAVGVLAPLIFGWATGHIEYGAFAALGALPAGFAAYQGVTRSRIAAIVVASAGMALTTFVGATTAATLPWLLIPVVIVLGYVTGLAVALGPLLSVAVLQWSVGLLIAVGLPQGPAEAGLRATLVLAGGLFQALLVAGSWTVRPGKGERTALAETYQALAAYASSLAVGQFGPPPPIVFPATSALDDVNPLLPAAERLMFLELLEEAERLRAGLAAMAAQAGSAGSEEKEEIRRLASQTITVLDLIVEALSVSRSERADRARDLTRQVAALKIAADAPWRWAGEGLLGQLRAVARIVARLEEVPQRSSDHAEVTFAGPVAESNIQVGLATLRANVTLTTEAGRHAVRLAIVTGLAATIVHATGLSQGRWVVLTIFLVLKPDYRATLSRSVERALGTVLGAGLGAVAAYLGYPNQGALVAAAGIAIASAYALFDVSYLVFSVFLTSFIVLLLDILGIPAVPTAETRVIDTAIGAVLALIAYTVWPTWEGVTAQEKFARLLDAHRQYVNVLLAQLARPSEIDLRQLRTLQGAARRARSDAEASTARLFDEPSHPPLTPKIARTLIAAVRRLAHAELALHALIIVRQRRAGQVELTVAQQVNAFTVALDTALSRLIVSLKTLQPPVRIPALRPLQTALRDQAATVDGALVTITDALVDTIDTLDVILRDRVTWPKQA
jgi:hypothetical protein